MILGDIMGREQTRKQLKKDKKNIKEEEVREELNTHKAVFKLMRILTIILFLLIIIYILVGVFITKEIKFGEKKKDADTNNSTFSSTNILASEIFKMPEEEYFLYFYDYNKPNTDIESAILNRMSGFKIYRIDTSSAFNSKYVDTIGNSNFQSLEELKVVSPTMVKIENNKNVKYVSGDTNIISYIYN